MAKVYRTSPVMPAPTLVNGRPTRPWQPTSGDTPVEWGTYKVEIGPEGSAPTDVTNLRGAPMEEPEWESRDPMADFVVPLRFPQVTGFDNVQTPSGDLAWLADGAQVTITLIRPDLTTKTLFEGLVEDWTIEENGASGALVVTAIGANYQVNDFTRGPGVDNADIDIGASIKSNFDPSAGVRPSLQTSALTIVGGTSSTTIGITSAKRGAWERTGQFVDELLAQTVSASGLDQWTIDLNRPRQPVLKKRDRTTVHWTLTFGTRNAGVQLHRDWSQCFNVIYGEGIDSAGGTWRNLKLNGSSVFWQPLAYDPLVHGFDENVSGGLDDNSARCNDALRRRELFINFGEGISKAAGKLLAEQLRLQMADPGWLGTITLPIDPEEGSRFEMAAGQNIKLKYYAGSGATGVLFHITSARVSLKTGTVTLTVDSKFRSAEAVDQIIARNRDPRSPALSLRLGRSSSVISDRKVPWDDSAGAGWFPLARKVTGTSTVALTANTWLVTRILAAEGPEVIALAEFYASIATQFAVAVFDWNIGTGLPINPLTTATDWSASLPGCLMAYGRLGQRGGYSDPTGAVDGLESKGDPVTGKLLDSGPWTISHVRGTASGSGDASNSGSPAFLWIAVFAAASCSMYGRLYHGVS